MPLWREHHQFLLVQKQTCGRLENFFLKDGLPSIPTITITSERALSVPPIGVSSVVVRSFVPVHLSREILDASMLSDHIAQAGLCHADVTDAEFLTIPLTFWPVRCFWSNGLQCFGLCHSDLRAHIGSAQFSLCWLKSEEWLILRVCQGLSKGSQPFRPEMASLIQTLQDTV